LAGILHAWDLSLLAISYQMKAWDTMMYVTGVTHGSAQIQQLDQAAVQKSKLGTAECKQQRTTSTFIS
jgi:hypothetical protein